METGKIDFLKNGPVIWCDCADSEVCCLVLVGPAIGLSKALPLIAFYI
jgi:hypothetical protein